MPLWNLKAVLCISLFYVGLATSTVSRSGDNLKCSRLGFILLQCESWKSNSVLHTWKQVSLLDEPFCQPTYLFLGRSNLGEMQEWVRGGGEAYMFLMFSRSGVVAAPPTLILSCKEYFYFLVMLVTLGSVCFCALSEFFSFIITRVRTPAGSRPDSS